MAFCNAFSMCGLYDSHGLVIMLKQASYIIRFLTSLQVFFFLKYDVIVVDFDFTVLKVNLPFTVVKV